MDLIIRRLTPDMAQAYADFFDRTPHDTGVAENRCYCVCWSGADSEGADFSTAEKRRALAIRYVQSGALQGYLAYAGDEIVGWCNANAKADCLRCLSWRMFMQNVPAEDASAARVKAVFCFVVAPEWRRRGVAGALLERVCADAAAEGYQAVEAYPNARFISESEDFRGPRALYEKHGFKQTGSVDDWLILRKAL